MSLGSTASARMSIGEAMDRLVRGGLPVRFTAYDGSSAGPPDAEIGLHLKTERGLAYLMTAPGDLGMARAYVSGDLDLTGVHPADPYDAMVLLKDHTKFRMPTPSEGIAIARGLGLSHLRPPAPPPQEHLPRWRRAVEGLRHSMSRDAEVISHHYDVSNRFYEMVLGPSMAYTCALYETPDATLEEAQFAKFDLVARKLDLKPGQTLLDVGCGWGSMVRHAAREYGVKALGVTLSLEQAEWAKGAIDREGLGDLAEVRHMDYRDVLEGDFDAISSIGLLEHIGVRNYASYFSHLRGRLKPGGRLLNHCITRAHNKHQETGAFIDRYVFPDGELIGSGTIISAAQDQGLEVQHSENLRLHYAATLRDWNKNLVDNWDECVKEVGEGTARVWGLYIAGSRVGFERDEIELHQVLATRNDDHGVSGFPMRPDWKA
ncbi:class I SAM-dependent methyltransferase [Nocardioides oleivorans]|uniref:Class I SAM-dependent methyltransferase n=2 Tax=Nocardioides oleivorans TaxID=273676 RepID=A0A4Q2RUL0_9ACTN|nr:class I SAM-dependent methyltransferase [Nocardioides oleivorans]